MTDANCRVPESWRRFLSPAGALVFGLVLGSPSTVCGQGQLLGAIHGTVKDQQGGVLPGAVITATPSEARPPHVTTTDAAGYFGLKDLPPGDYVVRVELEGFATVLQPGVLARAGRTLSLDLTLSIGGVDEVVTVRRDSPLLEASSATTAVNVSGDFQRALPTSQRRNWSDSLALVPGVVAADAQTGGLTQNYYVHGSSVSSHVFQVDGADLGAASISQPFYIALNPDLIADVQIKTAGVDASAPLGTGAVMNVTTKSGTNVLSGAVTLVFQPVRWNSTNVPGGTSPQVKLVQPDASVGGPILKDRLWYFGAYRRIAAATGVARTASQLTLLSQLQPSFRPFNVESSANLYFFKLTAAPFPSHRLTGFYQSDVNRSEAGGPQNTVPTLSQIGGNAANVRLSSSWGQSVTSELAVSYNDKAFESPPIETGEPLREIYRNATLSSGRWLGATLLANTGAPSTRWTSQPSHKLTISNDWTYVTSRTPGTHELKTGVFLQPTIHNSSIATFVNGGHALERLVLADVNNPSAGLIPFQRSHWPESTVSFRSRGSDLAGYVQDLWRLGRLTTTAGLRIDRVVYRDTVFDVTTQRSIEVGPRVGFNYAMRSDGKSMARFTWSRVHDRIAGAASAGIVTPSETRHFDLNLDGTFETVDIIPGSSSLTRNRLFADTLHQPYVNEWTVGYRHQPGRGVSLDANLVRRQIRDRFAMVDINGVYDGALFKGYLDESQNEIYLATNNKWNWPLYTAFELTATQRSSRIELIASYTRQWQRLNGTWQPNDPASFIQPGAFPDDRGIGAASGSSLSAPTEANSYLSFKLDRFVSSPWRNQMLRLGGTVQVGLGFTLAANYTFQAGPWSGPIVTRLPTPDPAFGPPTVVLPSGRVVPNPLATVLRFAHTTRSEGQFRLANYHALNLRMSKDIVRGRRRFTVMADVYNATNGDADQGLVADGNVLGSPNYGVTSNRQVPRGAQLGGRFTF